MPGAQIILTVRELKYITRPYKICMIDYVMFVWNTKSFICVFKKCIYLKTGIFFCCLLAQIILLLLYYAISLPSNKHVKQLSLRTVFQVIGANPKVRWSGSTCKKHKFTTAHRAERSQTLNLNKIMGVCNNTSSSWKGLSQIIKPHCGQFCYKAFKGTCWPFRSQRR